MGLIYRTFAPDYYFDDIYELTPEWFAERGISGIISDIDNTLEPYEEPEPTARLLEWLEQLERAGIKLAFVSNNEWERVERFNSKLGYFAAAKSGKPFKRELLAAMKHMGTDSGNTAMLGDQLFTDIYAGRRLKLCCVLVKPIRDKKTLFFRFKRALERPILKKYNRLKKKEIIK